MGSNMGREEEGAWIAPILIGSNIGREEVGSNMGKWVWYVPKGMKRLTL